MSKWKVHSLTDENRIDRYQCGLVAGQIVALRKDLVVHDHKGEPTGVVHPKGERWQVLPGIRTDPVLRLLQPDGNWCTWDDDPAEVREWFELIEERKDT